PASAKNGDNVASTSSPSDESVGMADKKMKWHRGPSVLEALDLLEPQSADVDLPLRFCVQDLYRFDERRIIAGRIETGKLRVGDELVFSPANKASKVQSIEEWDGAGDAEALDGDSIGITLSEQIFVERGYVASHQTDTPIEANRIHADVFWIVREPMRSGRLYDLRLATQEVNCEIVSINPVMDSSSLDDTSMRHH